MKVLISQHTPTNMSSFEALKAKYGASVDFRPFFVVEPVSSREFRDEKIELKDYTAVVFSSRLAIDAYFKLCEETRFKVPETMKYFCLTEAVAMYLQKHIVYRKRKIFFGNGKSESIISLIGQKHKDERFLITLSAGSNSDDIEALFTQAGLNYSLGVLTKAVPQDLKDLNLHDYDLAVLFNKSDVQSLKENFPDFKQDDLKLISFGKSVVPAMEEAGLNIAVKAPTPEMTSVCGAIEYYLQNNM